jgi:pentapeptide MXKDX repeat protein
MAAFDARKEGILCNPSEPSPELILASTSGRPHVQGKYPVCRPDGGTNDKQESLMNAYRTIIFTAMLVAGIATGASAQGTMAAPKDTMAAPKDSMAMDKPMKSDGMKHGGMKKTSMKADTMKSGSMKADSMKHDSMTTPAH